MNIEISSKLNEKIQDTMGYRYSMNLISSDDVEQLIEDLISKIEHLKEELESLEQNIQENYKPIPVSEQCGISDRDFF